MPETDETIKPRILWHQSGVNQRGEPFVQLVLDGKVIAQQTPQEARDHARAITEAAEASEQDAFMLTFMRERVRLDDESTWIFLRDFREWRTARTGKKSGASSRTDWVR